MAGGGGGELFLILTSTSMLNQVLIADGVMAGGEGTWFFVGWAPGISMWNPISRLTVMMKIENAASSGPL